MWHGTRLSVRLENVLVSRGINVIRVNQTSALSEKCNLTSETEHSSRISIHSTIPSCVRGAKHLTLIFIVASTLFTKHQLKRMRAHACACSLSMYANKQTGSLNYRVGLQLGIKKFQVRPEISVNLFQNK